MVAPVVDVSTAAELDTALANAPVVSFGVKKKRRDEEKRKTLQEKRIDRRSNALCLLSFSTSSLKNKSTLQAVVSFWASWAAGPCNQMDAVAAELAKDYANSIPFFRIEADAAATAAAAEKLGVKAVPTTVFVKSGVVSAKVEGPDPPALADAVAAQLGPPPTTATAAAAAAAAAATGAAPAPSPSPSPSGVPTEPLDASGNLTEPAKEALGALVKKHPVMLFMKGDPEQPRCGFSRKVMEALHESGAVEGEPGKFGTFDILSDEGVRSGLKVFSDWPTFPQLYVSGELVGGCDIVLEMAQGGTLKKTVEEMLNVL